MLVRLASDAVLDAAYAWLCQRRQDYPANADIWSFGGADRRRKGEFRQSFHLVASALACSTGSARQMAATSICGRPARGRRNKD